MAILDKFTFQIWIFSVNIILENSVNGIIYFCFRIKKPHEFRKNFESSYRSVAYKIFSVYALKQKHSNQFTTFSMLATLYVGP